MKGIRTNCNEIILVLFCATMKCRIEKMLVVLRCSECILVFFCSWFYLLYYCYLFEHTQCHGIFGIYQPQCSLAFLLFSYPPSRLKGGIFVNCWCKFTPTNLGRLKHVWMARMRGQVSRGGADTVPISMQVFL